jgi:hypothetical protein
VIYINVTVGEVDHYAGRTQTTQHMVKKRRIGMRYTRGDPLPLQ